MPSDGHLVPVGQRLQATNPPQRMPAQINRRPMPVPRTGRCGTIAYAPRAANTCDADAILRDIAWFPTMRNVHTAHTTVPRYEHAGGKGCLSAGTAVLVRFRVFDGHGDRRCAQHGDDRGDQGPGCHSPSPLSRPRRASAVTIYESTPEPAMPRPVLVRIDALTPGSVRAICPTTKPAQEIPRLWPPISMSTRCSI